MLLGTAKERPVVGFKYPLTRTTMISMISIYNDSDKNQDSRITIEEFKEYCLDNTDVKSWIDYYDDIGENWTVYDADMDPVQFAKAVQSENVVKVRSVEEAMALAGNHGLLAQRDRLTGRKVSF